MNFALAAERFNGIVLKAMGLNGQYLFVRVPVGAFPTTHLSVTE